MRTYDAAAPHPPHPLRCPTRNQRASAVPIAALRGHDLTAAERSALLECYANSDRTFLEIATSYGVDRERLHDLWFDLFLTPSRR